MSEYDPQYPVFECCICLINSPDSVDYERKKEGDIIGTRRHGIVAGVGAKETKERLWILIEGLDETELGLLGITNYDPDPDGEPYDKRRYSIPLDRLKEVFPVLDIARCRDADDMYQPFLTLDGDDYTFLTEENALEVSGLVYDKYIGEYL